MADNNYQHEQLVISDRKDTVLKLGGQAVLYPKLNLSWDSATRNIDDLHDIQVLRSRKWHDWNSFQIKARTRKTWHCDISDQVSGKVFSRVTQGSGRSL